MGLKEEGRRSRMRKRKGYVERKGEGYIWEGISH